jgi:hypothetical protein
MDRADFIVEVVFGGNIFRDVALFKTKNLSIACGEIELSEHLERNML